MRFVATMRSVLALMRRGCRAEITTVLLSSSRTRIVRSQVVLQWRWELGRADDITYNPFTAYSIVPNDNPIFLRENQYSWMKVRKSINVLILR